MHWYGGSIAEAVNLSKQKNAIFVVFVEGDNELSTEMAATIDDNVVLSRLADQTNFLAIKLKSGSNNYTHFAQIYQFVPVPSLFFIGRNGTPLEVVCAGVQPQNLATRIDRILEEHNKDKMPGARVLPSTSAQHIKDQTVNFLQSEAAPVPPPPTAQNDGKPDAENTTDTPTPPKVSKTEHPNEGKSGQEYEVVCDGDVCMRKPRGEPDEPGPSRAPAAPAPLKESQVETTESAASIEEKMLRAKELIEARRLELADKEKDAEKEKELERRTTGKGVAELKRWQAEQELKHIQEERKREKMENNLARQRILEQIAQDRAERRARDAPQPAAPAPAPAPAAPAPTAASPAPATSGDASARARIQFKLPDGTSHTAHFDADSTLDTVHRYVADNLQMSASSFSLWTAFPRRELSAGGDTLRALQLAPSAALLVLPARPARPAPALARPTAAATLIAFLTQIFTSFILEPTHQVYAWLRGRIFPPPPAPRAAGPPPPPPAPPGPTLRRRGNIHRIPNDRTSDDENNTWNGNSTQQM